MEPNKISAPDNPWKQSYDQATPIPDSKFMATYMSKVYGWMFLGLTITAMVAYFISVSETTMQFLLGSRIIFFGLIFGQLILVGYLVVRILKMSALTATLVFLGYAALNGVTFSVILRAYTPGSLMSVFAITAGTFGIMSAVGYFTRQDLTSFGRLMMMGLIGVIVASVVNFFMHSSTLYWIISYVAVAVFVGLIAYDTQKIKAYALLESEEDRKKGAIMGALALYLDFVNLFIYLLRLLGRRN